MRLSRTFDPDREPDRSAAAPGRVTRPGTAPHVEPALGLQAAAGNAAVTSLLRRTGDLHVQQFWEEDEEAVDGGGEPEEAPAPAEGPAPDDATEPADAGSGEGDVAGSPDLGEVEARARTDLDPAAVLETLAPYADTGSGPGDDATPGDGATAQALFVQREPPDGPGPAPRAGGPGDVLKALMPFLQPALDRLLANVTDAIARLKAGEKIATVVVLAPIVIGPLTQPGPRRLALDQLDGTDVTFGAVPNLQVKPIITDGQLKGGTVTYDLAPALRKLGLPF